MNVSNVPAAPLNKIDIVIISMVTLEFTVAIFLQYLSM